MQYFNRLEILINLFGITRVALATQLDRNRVLIERDITSKAKAINLKFVYSYIEAFEELSLEKSNGEYIIYLKQDDIQYMIND